MGQSPSHSTKGRETSIDGHGDPGYKRCSRREQPEACSSQVGWIAKASHWRMGKDRSAPRCHLARLTVSKQEAILLGEKESRCNGVDTDARRVLLSHMHRQPLRKIGHACLGSRIRRDSCE